MRKLWNLSFWFRYIFYFDNNPRHGYRRPTNYGGFPFSCARIFFFFFDFWIYIICDDEEFIYESIFLDCTIPSMLLNQLRTTRSFPHFSTEIINYGTRVSGTSKTVPAPSSIAGRRPTGQANGVFLGHRARQPGGVCSLGDKLHDNCVPSDPDVIRKPLQPPPDTRQRGDSVSIFHGPMLCCSAT